MYEKMMDKVVRKFGFEDKRTIAFFELCECAGSSYEGWEAVHNDFEALMAEAAMLDEE